MKQSWRFYTDNLELYIWSMDDIIKIKLCSETVSISLEISHTVHKKLESSYNSSISSYLMEILCNINLRELKYP